QLDGEEFSQSTAILRYAGKLAGLVPEDPLSAFKVDEIVMICVDMLGQIFKCYGQKDDAVAKTVMEGKVR
ncbi:unnamed protein product, partial [Hapterophycus canaliculatus]